LNSEDALRAQHKEDVAVLNKEWQAKLGDVVAKARAEEQEKARQMLQRTADEFNRKEMDLVSQLRDKDGLIGELNTKINELMQEI
jgi:hypothetical protein